MPMDSMQPGQAVPHPAAPLAAHPVAQGQPLSMERMADLERRVGLKKSQLWQLIREGKFPAPVKVGRASLFVSAEVDAWLRDRIRQTREGLQ